MTIDKLCKLIRKAQSNGMWITVELEAVEPEDGGGVCGSIHVDAAITANWSSADLFFDSAKELKSILSDPHLEDRAKRLSKR